MTPDGPRYGSDFPSSTGMRRRPDELPSGGTTRGGRRLGGVDHATVAIALSGMTMYWLMPALLARGRPRRRPRRAPTPRPRADNTQ